jgi:hypothetical protein
MVQISSHVYNHCVYHIGAWGGGGGVHFFDGGISRKVWPGFMYMSVYSSNSSPQSECANRCHFFSYLQREVREELDI